MDLDRYARQIVMEQIGLEGQRKISEAEATVAGLGGLGSIVCLQLVGMGIGKINIVDRDIVTKTDLHRQYLYSEKDIGRLKVYAAKERLEMLNSDVKINPVDEVIDDRSSEYLVENSDIVIDCLDSPWSKYSLNRACIKKKKPYIFASAIRTYAIISTIIPGETACLNCIYPEMDKSDLANCAIAGVHPSILAIAASVQVSEAINVIIGKEPLLKSKILFVDLSSLSFETINVLRNADCSECGSSKTHQRSFVAPFLERSCSRDGVGTYFVNPDSKEIISMNYEDLEKSGVHKAFEDSILTLLLKKDGRAIVLVKGRVYDIDELEREIVKRYNNIIKAEKLTRKAMTDN